VNDAPQGADNTVTTLEDTAYTFSAADFGFSDANDSPANSLLAVTITTVPGAGILTHNGLAVSLGQSVALADINAGRLVFTPATHANGGGYASFTFQVQDDGGTTNGGADLDASPNTLTVNVTSVNDAPQGADNTVTTNEDTAYTFAAADFGFGDANDSPANNLLAVTITAVPGAGTLTHNGLAVSAGQSVALADIAAGRLVFTPATNASGGGYASFTFQVQDDGGTANGVDLDPTPNTLTVNVTAVNDAPQGADNTVTTLEDTAYTFSAADFGFSDANDSPANSLLAVTITTLPGAGALTNNGAAVSAGQSVALTDIAAGRLVFTPVANANGGGYASFTFQVQDDGGTTNGGADLDASPNTLTVNVTSVNDTPQGANNTVTTLEDTAYTFVAVDFGFSDANDSPANSLLAVTITTLPGAGALTKNGAAASAGQSVALTDIAAGRLVFTPVANANGGGYASFSFQVQDDGGTTNGGADLDASPNTLTVNVTSVNDAPQGANNTVTTKEDTAYAFAAADFGFGDANDSPANSLLAVTITTLPSAGRLTHNGLAVSLGQSVTLTDIAAGRLIFTPVANANGGGYASFSFQVQDDGGTTNGGADLDASPNTLTVNVTPVNDAPQGADNTVTTNEDSAYTFAAADFGFGDANDSPANSLLAVTITTLPSAGMLTHNGLAVSLGQSVTLTDIAAGRLVFTPVANANGGGYASFTFQVQDDGGTTNGGADLDATPNTLTVNVTTVNDAPQGAANTVTTLEDTAYTFSAADFGFGDANDSPANSLLAVTITTLPSAGMLTHNGLAVSLGQSVTLTDIAADRLVFTPVANANGGGYASFTFQVQDDGGTANGVDLDPTPNTLTVNVTAVNDAPQGADNTVTTLEDTAYTFSAADFGFSDANDSPANSLLAVTITTLPGAGALTNNGAAVSAGQSVALTDIAAGRLVFTPVANANGGGYASFTFQVQDDGGTTNGGADLDAAPNTLTVNVTSVNDTPQGANNTVTTLEDTAYTFVAVDFGFSDANDSPANSLLAVTITTLPGAGALTNNGAAVSAGQSVALTDIAAGRLIFTPVANANGGGYASFTFQVQDDGGTTNGGADLDAIPNTLTIDVTAVNDAPAGIVTIDGTPTEDQTLTANVTAITDADGLGTFSYQWLRNGVSIAGASAASYVLGDADVGGRISVQVSYSDGYGTAELVTSTQTVAVANVNDLPTGVPTISGAVTEDQTLTADVSAISDADGLGAFNYQWLRDGIAITGASASSYTLGDADVGTRISVQLSYRDAQGTLEGPLTSAQTVAVVNINDVAVIAGVVSGSVTEDGVLVASGRLSISDADIGESAFVAATADSAAGYGVFSVSTAGDWTYTLRNAHAAVQGLAGGQHLADSFVVSSVDGTSLSISIVVVGSNDRPTASAVNADGSEDQPLAIVLSGADVDGVIASFRLLSATIGGALYLDAAASVPALIGVPYLATTNALTLYFRPLADWNGSSVFEYQAIDAQGAASAPAAVRLNLAPVADSPRLLGLTNTHAYLPNAPLDLGGMLVSDVDSASVSVTLSLSDPAAGRLSSSETGNLRARYNAATGTWYASGPIADVNVLLAGLRFVPSASYSANLTLTATVDDGEAPPVSATQALNTLATHSSTIAGTGGTNMAGVSVVGPALATATATSDALAPPVADVSESSDAAASTDTLDQLLTVAYSLPRTLATDGSSGSATGAPATATATVVESTRHAAAGSYQIAVLPDWMSAEFSQFVDFGANPDSPSLSLSGLAQTGSGSAGKAAAFARDLDDLRASVKEGVSLEKYALNSAVAVSSGLSVGYVAWLIRGGVLVSAMLSSMPAWRVLDPFPVLARQQGSAGDDGYGDEDDDDDSLESLESLVGDEQSAADRFAPADLAEPDEGLVSVVSGDSASELAPGR
jgi:VCBS repeat-containing protein